MIFFLPIRVRTTLKAALLISLVPFAARAQRPVAPKLDKRIFGVLPNYRTADGAAPFEPLSARRKLVIASKDSFDWPVLPLSGAFAALSQLEDQDESFGQGAKGFGRRLGAAYGDQMIGNMMTEAIFPSLLHEDPRYFRQGSGRKWGRAGYALTRILVTHTDAGGQRFNFSEVLGNSAATVISNAYHPNQLDFSDNAIKLMTALATDSLSNVLKEFWPDIKRHFKRRHAVSASAPAR